MKPFWAESGVVMKSDSEYETTCEKLLAYRHKEEYNVMKMSTSFMTMVKNNKQFIKFVKRAQDVLSEIDSKFIKQTNRITRTNAHKTFSQKN